MTTIYGIKTCDTVRKARAWLDAHGIAHRFHDYRVEGIDETKLAGWAKVLGWEKLLNKSGPSFRSLPDADKADLTEAKAIALMLANATLIKRPVLEASALLLLGFKPEDYAAKLG